MKHFNLLIVLLLIAASVVNAQDATPEVTPETTRDPALGGAPTAVQDALAMLNQELGTNLTLSTIEWTWSEEAFSDASLGCPQEGMMYAQVITRGYTIIFEHEGATYDFRSTQDGSNIVMCETTSRETETGDTGTTPELSADAITAANAADLGEFSRLNTAQGVSALADWSADGTVIVAVSSAETGGVYIYPSDDPNAEAQFYETEEPVVAVDTVAVNGITYLATGGLNGRIAYFQIVPPGFDVVLMQDELVEGGQGVSNLALSPDGNILASATGTTLADGHAVYLWNPRTGGLFATMTHNSPVTAVAFARAGVTSEATAEVTPEATPEATAEAGNTEEFLLAVGTNEGVITLYNVSYSATADSVSLNYRIANSMSGHEGAIRALEFNPAGTLLASGSMDGSARLWSIENGALGEEIALLNNPTEDAVISVAFSPDGTLLATAGGNPNAENVDNAIRLWDVTTPDAVQNIITLTGHEAAVGSLDFSADGAFLMSAADDGSIRLWKSGK